MLKIGLISDTHSYLDPNVFMHFETCDEIWHIGDIGQVDVIQKLSDFKPTKAVFGNIDAQDVRELYPENMIFELEGLKILMTHIGALPPSYNPRIRELLKKHQPNLFICGHSHILRVIKDIKYNNLLYINPGAAGKHGFHKIRTIMRMDLGDGKIKNMEVIELGTR
jgi:putative phosphoesterase